jgi:hypothetical protein
VEEREALPVVEGVEVGAAVGHQEQRARVRDFLRPGIDPLADRFLPGLDGEDGALAGLPPDEARGAHVVDAPAWSDFRSGRAATSRTSAPVASGSFWMKLITTTSPSRLSGITRQLRRSGATGLIRGGVRKR